MPSSHYRGLWTNLNKILSVVVRNKLKTYNIFVIYSYTFGLYVNCGGTKVRYGNIYVKFVHESLSVVAYIEVD